MAGKMKVLLIGVCAAAVAVTGTVGGLKTYRSLHKKPVKVYALREVAMTDYMDGGDSMTGSIMTEGLQNVYLSETLTVRQIFVSAGQQVKKGDPLLSFDTTLSEIEVRKAEIEVSRNKLALSKAEKTLEKLKKTKPYEPKEDIPGSRLSAEEAGDGTAYMDTEADTPSAAEGQDTAKSSGQASFTGQTPFFAGGKGTEEEPYRYIWGDKDRLSDDWLLSVLKKHEDKHESSVPDPASSSDSDENGSGQSGTSSADPAVPDSSDTPGSPGTTNSSDTPDSPGTTNSSDTPDSSDTTNSSDDTLPDSSDSEASQVLSDTGSDVTSPGSSTVAEPVSSAMSPHADGETVSSGHSTAEDTAERNPNECYVILERHADNTPEGKLLSSFGLHLTLENGKVYTALFVPGSDETHSSPVTSGEEVPADPGMEDPGMEDPGEYPDPADPGEDPEEVPEETYTKAELQKKILETKTEIRDLNLEVRLSEVRLKRIKEEMSDGVIRSTLDGTVKTVLQPDDAKKENRPCVSLSEGGSYLVNVPVSELNLDSCEPGISCTVTSMEAGSAAEGVVQSISQYPDQSGNGYSSGNPDVSYYPCTVSVSETAEFKSGELVNVSFHSGGDGGSGIYLDQMYIRTDGAGKYVYLKGEDGKLKKQAIRTGRDIGGGTLQVKSGLSADDSIAFPYGDNIEEGAKTKDATAEELYGGE